MGQYPPPPSTYVPVDVARQSIIHIRTANPCILLNPHITCISSTLCISTSLKGVCQNYLKFILPGFYSIHIYTTGIYLVSKCVCHIVNIMKLNKPWCWFIFFKPWTLSVPRNPSVSFSLQTRPFFPQIPKGAREIIHLFIFKLWWNNLA